MANIATKANLIYFKKIACPAIKPQMLDGMESGMKDFYNGQVKKGKTPTAQELFTQAKSNKDLNFIYQKSTISDSEIMAIAERISR